MDGHLFRRCCDALEPRLRDARLVKVQSPLPDVLTFDFHRHEGPGRGEGFQLCLRHGRVHPFLFLDRRPFRAGVPASSQVMRLRKLACGAKVVAVVSLPWERRLWLLLKRSDFAVDGGTLPWLCLDLREGARILRLSPEETPRALEVPWPSREELLRALEPEGDGWRRWPMLTPALRRTLARLDPAEGAALLEDLRAGEGDVFCLLREGRVVDALAWPMPRPLSEGVSETSGEDVAAMLERAGRDMVLDVKSGTMPDALPGRERRRRERLRARLQEDRDRLQGMVDREPDALALQEQLWRLPRDAAGCVRVEASAHGPERVIPLEMGRTPVQQMQALFKEVGKGKRGLAHLERRLAALDAEPAPSRAPTAGQRADPPGSAPVPGRKSPRVHIFVSSDGFTMLRGRDGRGNLEARKLAAPHDVWVHARDGAGAHVIIRRPHHGREIPDRTMDEAGGLALNRSQWRDDARAWVIYAEVRHVRPVKGAKAGTVTVDALLASRLVDVDGALETRLSPDNSRGDDAPGP
jgi:hypothetical protein